ncbi:MAG: peptidoglycan-associated lipoprotein [Leptothrix sp. (in: Bacteria)]|nr:peptidoglycan-associated lipoprotein [Leptothrix sp. (in: b-proteobacteria)]
MTIRPHRLTPLAALSATLVLLAACGTTKLPEQAAAPVVTAAPAAAAPAPAPAAPATATGTAQSRVTSVDLANSQAAAAAAAAALTTLPSQRIVYFDFDSYVIKSDFQPTLEAFARVLAANNGKKLAIEGHADERGSREYNLALGQKRAAAVLNSLKLLGAMESQMEAVSFGEERPAATGSDESAWAKNRRAELKDR